jgi:hypothetical protein
MIDTAGQTDDHMAIEDMRLTRRYLGKFEAILAHLRAVLGVMEAERRLSPPEVEAVARYLVGLSLSFEALSHKYLFAGRTAMAGKLTFDRVESGYPVHAEFLVMANDAAQAEVRLAGMPSEAALKDEMVRVILAEQVVPAELQFALSQRLYYEELRKGGLFWARNDPEALWLGDAEGRRRYLIRWAVHDSRTNLPVIHLMEVTDSGRTGLPKDQRRWPAVQAHLMAQAVGDLKLVTIATGFDRDFPDLHPKRLRRFRVGPMHSHSFTIQTGPLRDVLARAMAPEGEDWALVWTEEDLVSERVEVVETGWFGQAEREIFALDTVADSGATRMERALVLPQRPYQALAELDPPGLRGLRKFVVGAGGKVLSYR